uniref:Uncharacterized protein n=1 Tax=Anguilla anguilla TaxID=7936 RepID=A0A0E9VXT3_ANGAN
MSPLSHSILPSIAQSLLAWCLALVPGSPTGPPKIASNTSALVGPKCKV